MPAPVHRLKKTEIVWLAQHQCRHGHRYLDHYACYLDEQPDTERIGFFDIETTHLKGNFGLMLAYCIMDDKTEEIHSALITKADILNPKVRDKRVVEKLIKDLEKFDQVVTFYGTKFDIPFSRTRAMIHGLEFPSYGTLKHKDVYYVVRHKFSLHSNRLENACRTLVGSTGKTSLQPALWQAAAYGDRKALVYILDHCKEDVRDLRRLYWKVLEYAYPGVRAV